MTDDFKDRVKNILNRSTVTFKTDKEQLLAAASVIEKKINDMNKHLEHISDEVHKTNDYWEGKVAVYKRNMFLMEKNVVYNALERLLIYVGVLESIASNYEITEKKNVESAESLPVDVIS